MFIRVCVVLAFLFSSISFGQFAEQGRNPFVNSSSDVADITGQVVFPPGTPVSTMSVELCEAGGAHFRIRETSISGTGAFFFSGIAPSMYLVRLTDRAGEILAEEYVDSANGIGRVQLRLEARRHEPPGTVSVAELSHKVPVKAQKEAEAANKALAKRDFARYVAHLEKAVELDPEFMTAHKNLALGYLKIRQYQKGIEALRALLRLDPRSIVAYCAMAAAYLDLHRYADAETAAETALDIEPSAELGHFLLGCSLSAQNKNLKVALDHLRKAANRYPMAHITAAAIWSRAGDHEEAKSQLQAYLDSGDQDGRAEAEDMLNKLD